MYLLKRLRTIGNFQITRTALSLLGRRDRSIILLNLVLQFFLGILDLIGVVFLGALAGLSITGISSSKPRGRILQLLETLNIETFSFQQQVAILGSMSALTLTSRTALSLISNFKLLEFLSKKSSQISSNLAENFISQNLGVIQRFTLPEIVYILTSGVSKLTVGIIGISATILSDIALLIILFCGLLIVDLTMALATFFIFSFIAWSLYRTLGARSEILGVENSRLNLESERLIHEAILSYRESVVRDRRNFYSESINRSQTQLAKTMLGMSFLPTIGKYVLEISVVIGGLVLAAVQFIRNDAYNSAATLTLFIAAASRIAPAIMRIQQGALQIREAVGSASPTLLLISQIGDKRSVNSVSKGFTTDHRDFVPVVQLKNVSFKYSGSSKFALTDVNLKVEPGSQVAIVGPSGSGKSTLLDIILGINEPMQGEVLISGVNPKKAFSHWPGAVSYVPQNVFLSAGTLKSNVTSGFNENEIDSHKVIECLASAQLGEFIAESPFGINMQVGDRGQALSGGQKQRVGIARALLSNPRIIFLDEATSALDSETEAAIAETIQNLKGRVSIVIVAHRLSTIKSADKVIYLSHGKILAVGTFDEVRAKIPEFNNQAILMGL
jgi:ABC-type multidrug transport system fused ATPase/permease subunit